MNKRLLKRHKRQVSRAKERTRLSEPDLRTPEQIQAAREASRSNDGRSKSPQSNMRNSLPAVRNRAVSPAGSAAKTDA
jgi:hypothetical protein